jgi:hypothetical protein
MRYSTHLNFIKYILPLGVLIYSTWCGLGLTYDSYDYLSAARSLADHGSLLNADGSLYCIHAPFFPILISIIIGKSLFPLKIFQVIIFMGSLFMIDKIIESLVVNSLLKMMAFLAISLSVGIHMAHNFIWTEPFFILIFLLHNYCLISLIKSYRFPTLLILIISGFLLGVTRNAGVFIIIPTAIILFFHLGKKSSQASLTYLVLSISGFTVWNMYALVKITRFNTFKQGGTFYQDIFASMLVYPDVISKWFLPPFIPLAIRLIILGAILILTFMLIMKFKNLTVPKVFLFQFAVYLFSIVPILVVENSEAEKLLSIVYPFVVVSIIMLLEASWIGIKKSVRSYIFIALSIWIGYISLRTVKNSIMWHKNNCYVEIRDLTSIRISMIDIVFF